MKTVLCLSLVSAFALVLTGCGNSGSGSSGPQASTGPFDNRGNYVEEWADNPSKWKRTGRGPSPHELKTDDLPQIAANDQPPQNSVPLVSAARVSRPEPVTNSVTASRPAVASTREVVVKSGRPVTQSESAVVKAKPKAKPEAKPEAKPKTTVAKVKPKPKPKATRYVVKKGDSLSTIASRNGTTVSAIKSANSISGTLIRPGQTLSLPKR